MISKPHYVPTPTEENCTLCEECVTKCPMDAWSIVGERLIFNKAKCIGCGLCVPTCPENAIQLVKKTQEIVPPETVEMRYDSLMAEKKDLSQNQ